MLVGYARVSLVGQSLEVQLDALREAGCEKVFAEKKSGTSTSGRDALAEALDFVRDSSDTLVVTRLDRLARSAGDLHAIVAKLSLKGVGFKCLQQGAMDTSTSTGKLLLGVLASIAEFETDIRKERQREGIDKAKANGVYKGRKPSVDVATVRSLHSEGIGASSIAKRLGISGTTVEAAQMNKRYFATRGVKIARRSPLDASTRSRPERPNFHQFWRRP